MKKNIGDFMDSLLLGSIDQFIAPVKTWLTQYIFDVGSFLQILVAAMAYLLASLLATPLKKLIMDYITKADKKFLRDSILPLVLPAIWLFIQWMLVLIGNELGWRTFLISRVATLLTAWVVIRFVCSFVREPSLSKFIAVTAWTIAALDIFNLLDISGLTTSLTNRFFVL